jgi:hypothetical protein
MYTVVIFNVQLLVLIQTHFCVVPHEAASNSLCTASNLTMINLLKPSSFFTYHQV